MVYLTGMIAAVADAGLREELTERLDIVRHKIKFMDPVPVFCCDAGLQANVSFYEMLEAAGGMLQTSLEGAVYIICHEQGKGLNNLMSEFPPVIDSGWAPVQNNRIILMDQDAYIQDDAESQVSLVEDLAEMIHPGSFIFGHEGDKWLRLIV